MRHEDAVPLLVDLLEGLLPPPTELEVEDHLEQCVRCRSLLAEHLAMAAGDAARGAAPAALPRGALLAGRWAIPVGVLALAACGLAWWRLPREPDLVTLGTGAPLAVTEPLTLQLFQRTPDGPVVLTGEHLQVGQEILASSPHGRVWVRNNSAVDPLDWRDPWWIWTAREPGVVEIISVSVDEAAFDPKTLDRTDWERDLDARGVAHQDRRLTVE